MHMRFALGFLCVLSLSACRSDQGGTAVESTAPDPPRSAPLAEQPADLIREECLASVTPMLQSAPRASYDPDDMPEFHGGRWTWASSVGEFVGGAEVPRAFTCTVKGSALDSAAISTVLQ